MSADKTVSAKSLEEIVDDVVRVIDELRGWTPPFNASEQPNLAAAWQCACRMKEDLASIKTKMAADDPSPAPVNPEIVKVEIAPWKIPTEINELSQWAIQFKQCMFDDTIDPPVGCWVMFRGIPDSGLRVSFPAEAFKTFVDELLQVANPSVKWNDNQLEMARDTIKTMRMDITTLCDSFIDTHNMHRMFDGDQF